MRLKEIKQGMAIHCTERKHVEYLTKNGFAKNYMLNKALPIWIAFFDENFPSINWMPEVNENTGTNGREYYENKGVKCVEFVDLVIPELSTEEILKIATEICDISDCDATCPLVAELEDGALQCMIAPKTLKTYSEEIPRVCTKWKAEHEKKEPEAEWVDICRIIENTPDGRKRCVYEEEIKPEMPFGGMEKIETEKVLKQYCKNHDGNFFAVHEAVCRVKAVD